MSIIKEFGTRLRAIREHNNLSQKALVDAINKTLGLNLRRNTVSNYENGISYPSIEVLRAIVTILDTSTDYLLAIENRNDSGVKKSLTERIELTFSELEIWRRNIEWLLELREKAFGEDPQVEAYLDNIDKAINPYSDITLGKETVTMTDRLKLADSASSLKNNIIKDFDELFREYFLDVQYPSKVKKKFAPPSNVTSML
ncbi:MAG: helix-turn-helix transcriptional regulator [Cyclobacteriaceae bacterium]|nr:helix-turn-helix transcriptional regulator [Cyclobacteriaceae bacterium]